MSAALGSATQGYNSGLENAKSKLTVKDSKAYVHFIAGGYVKSIFDCM
jgi:hypothetical protein